VDVVLTFDGDARSGLRVLSGGKNRFGADGEVAWFEMEAAGLREIDPSELLLGTDGDPGSATALLRAGRRALAVEIQALAVPTEGPGRRQVTGLDPRRFQLVAAVLERLVGLPVGHSDLFGATAGGVRVDDPACDLGIAAALASAVTGIPTPSASAFAGEVTLTGLVRPSAGLPQRLAAARAAGVRTVFGAGEAAAPAGLRFVQVRRVDDALAWAAVAAPSRGSRRSA
jgi:DNA repair protein RadA/Sms